uniref:SMODS and SLOG-associating 2TM effector domain-containing protein n=1 Tax=viral metagenome TaxID=1070528 RepID=A0A6C0L153_9ZZZZ|tara:strand:+ start:1261 stop:1995 length:735 start_codon:yes stop_codon:yes gene_type:complete
MDLVIETNADETDSDKSTEESLVERLKQIQESSDTIHNEFNKRNKKIIEQKVDDRLKMNIKYEREFKEHLQKKLNKLDTRLNILQMKYNNYKKWYDRFNIMIIIISSILSVYEALRNEINKFIEDESPIEVLFNMIPIGISSSITCSAAIIKFKKYQEKMENMQFTREKVIMAISKIKTVQETLWFINDTDFEVIKKKYLDDVYTVYNESNSELERHIKFNDHHKFMKAYHPPPVEKPIRNSFV